MLRVSAACTASGLRSFSTRPISPHVSIYKFPVAALSSITNRATGVGLSFAVVGLGVNQVLGGSATVLVDAVSHTPVIGTLAKTGLGFAMVYHTLGGIRHFYWDTTGNGLSSMATVDQSCYALVGVSTVSALGLATYSWEE